MSRFGLLLLALGGLLAVCGHVVQDSSVPGVKLAAAEVECERLAQELEDRVWMEQELKAVAAGRDRLARQLREAHIGM